METDTDTNSSTSSSNSTEVTSSTSSSGIEKDHEDISTSMNSNPENITIEVNNDAAPSSSVQTNNEAPDSSVASVEVSSSSLKAAEETCQTEPDDQANKASSKVTIQEKTSGNKKSEDKNKKDKNQTHEKDEKQAATETSKGVEKDVPSSDKEKSSKVRKTKRSHRSVSRSRRSGSRRKHNSRSRSRSRRRSRSRSRGHDRSDRDRKRSSERDRHRRRSESLERRREERKRRHAERDSQAEKENSKNSNDKVEDKQQNKPEKAADNPTENDNATVTDPKARITERQRRTVDLLTSRTGGAYIPPAKLRMMQAGITDKSSAAYQRIAWEALKKSIHGYINKVNVDNIAIICRELLKENIVRGRGLLCRSIIQAQAASPTFTHVYAALVAIINSKFPNIGELLLKRLAIQFKRAFRRNDKAVCLSSSRFIAHLINQRVAHEILALEILTLLVEQPTDDSVEVAIGFLKECGMKLTELTSKGIGAIFEMLKNILHEGKLEKRVQYMIEVVFQVRKDGFKDHQSVIEALELVEEEDQFTHTMMLDDANDTEDVLNAFKYDEQYENNEEKYKGLSNDILGSDAEGSDGSGSGSGSDSDSSDDDEENDEDKPTAGDIIDNTETNLIALRRTIYLTINSSLDYEECAHKLMKMQLKPGQEPELCHMFLDCCAEQRTYEKFYGLLAQRFCLINKIYIQPFEDIFRDTYQTTHRLDTNRLRNVSKFFAHLLFTDAISWDVLECIKLNEDDTTSSSRIFIKILFQELAEYMGLCKLNAKLKDEALTESLIGLFPKDNPRNTRFSINFFTSIGLGGLTDDLRNFLKTAPRIAPDGQVIASIQDLMKKEETKSSSSSSSSDSSSESSSSSGSSSDSESDSDSSSIDSGSESGTKRKKKSSSSKKTKQKKKQSDKQKKHKKSSKVKQSKKKHRKPSSDEEESSDSSADSSEDSSESSEDDRSHNKKHKKHSNKSKKTPRTASKKSKKALKRKHSTEADSDSDPSDNDPKRGKKSAKNHKTSESHSSNNKDGRLDKYSKRSRHDDEEVPPKASKKDSKHYRDFEEQQQHRGRDKDKYEYESGRDRHREVERDRHRYEERDRSHERKRDRDRDHDNDYRRDRDRERDQDKYHRKNRASRSRSRSYSRKTKDKSNKTDSTSKYSEKSLKEKG